MNWGRKEASQYKRVRLGAEGIMDKGMPIPCEKRRERTTKNAQLIVH